MRKCVIALYYMVLFVVIRYVSVHASETSFHWLRKKLLQSEVEDVH